MYMYPGEMLIEGRVKRVRALIVRKALGREFQRELLTLIQGWALHHDAGKYSGLATGSGCWCRVEGRLIFQALSGTKFGKKSLQWWGSRQWTKSKASMQRATLRRGREGRKTCTGKKKIVFNVTSWLFTKRLSGDETSGSTLPVVVLTCDCQKLKIHSRQAV